MLRADIEKQMKQKKQSHISLFMNKGDHLAMFCTMQSGYLVDCNNHRVDRKKDIWGYLEWDSEGNADRKDFAGTVCEPFIRKGHCVAGRNER